MVGSIRFQVVSGASLKGWYLSGGKTGEELLNSPHHPIAKTQLETRKGTHVQAPRSQSLQLPTPTLLTGTT